MAMTTGTKGTALIKFFEGFRASAYYDAVGVPTIGYGTTTGVKMGQTITEAQGEALLQADLRKFEAGVDKLVTVTLTQEQFDALVSFSYNLGLGNFGSSTLLKLVNAGRFDLAKDQFIRWNKAGGKVLDGLTKRRQAEATLFSTGKVVLK
jgi:lysozyme